MRHTLFAALALSLSSGGLGGCSEDLEANSADPAPDTEKVQTLKEGAVFATRIDATDEAQWVGYAFDVAGEAPEAEAHLTFQRAAVRLGVGVEAVRVETAFAELSTAPAEGWAAEPEGTDVAVGRDRPKGPLGAWFDYDHTFHTLSAADHRYAVRTAEGGCYKVQFLDWYDDAGTSAMYAFEWAALAGCR